MRRDILWNVDKAIDFPAGLRGACGASVIRASVWVIAFGFNAILLDVLESKVHQTTIAALVSEGGGAIDQLLLRELDQRAGLDGMETLQRSHSGEGPAGSAGALVLDLGHSVVASPVDCGWDGGWEGLDVACLAVGGGAEVDGLELGLGQVGELVDSNHEGELSVVGSLVVVLDLEDVGSVDLVSEIVFLRGGVELAVSLLPVDPRVMDGGLVDGGGAAGAVEVIENSTESCQKGQKADEKDGFAHGFKSFSFRFFF